MTSDVRPIAAMSVEQPSRLNRLMFVALSLDVGGAERHLALIAPELVHRGWPVSIFCLNRPGVFADRVRASGVDVIGPPFEAKGRDTHRVARAIYSGIAAGRLHGLIRRQRPAVVHFFLTEPYIFGAPASLLADVPIRIMSRRDVNTHQTKWRGVARIEAMLHQRMSAILGNSRRVVRDLVTEGCDPARLGLIYNGVDIAAFAEPTERAELRRELGLDENDIAAVMVANLISYKGHSDLLKALALLVRTTSRSLKLLIVGRDDGSRVALEKEAVELGLAGRVRFLGLRDDVPRLLKACDIGVHASHKEGFSNAVIESMAAGLAMVVTDVGGNAEAVHDERHGLVVQPHRPDLLAAALLRVTEDQELRDRYGQAAWHRVQETYSLSACVSRYEALYRGLLDGVRPCEIADVAIDQN